MRAHGLLVVLLAAPALAASIEVVVADLPGVGFNDATPAAPVGGNAGTTVGEQRLNAFRYAANLWGSTLDSKAPVYIVASFAALSCTATTAVLGSAGTISVFRDFPGAPLPGTWYHGALADKLAGEDLDPGFGDIRARFNGNLGNPGCLTGTGWYYGLDTGHTASQINLVTVLLHEFAHGLGFSSFANVSTGAYFLGLSDAYSRFYFDDTLGRGRDAMTDAERKASAINPRQVVWTGPKVGAEVASVLAPGTPLLQVSAPASVAGGYAVGPASFGAPLGATAVSGALVLALDPSDASGASTTDGCSAFTNAADVAGKLALLDRGTCGFVVKVKNAQNAGALGVVVADNAAGGPPAGLGGADPTITIPSVRITRADGLKLKAALAAGPVSVSLGVDLSVRAGADAAGRALLYTPDPVQPGSSVSHWDTIATPNQLMEPAINSDLKLSVDAPQDLTRAQLRDVGWYPDRDLDQVADDAGDQCLGSDLRGSLVLGLCDAGLPNTFFSSGCSVADLANRCLALGGGQAFEDCNRSLASALSGSGAYTRAQARAFQHAVERAMERAREAVQHPEVAAQCGG
jgi:hypothetical protein